MFGKTQDEPKQFVVMKYVWHDWNLWDLTYVGSFDSLQKAINFANDLQITMCGLVQRFMVFEKSLEVNQALGNKVIRNG